MKTTPLSYRYHFLDDTLCKAAIYSYILIIFAMHHVAYAVLLISSLVGISKADLLGEQQQPLQTSKREFDSEFDAFVEETLREWHVPGLSVAVIDKDTIISKVWSSFHPSLFITQCHVGHL